MIELSKWDSEVLRRINHRIFEDPAFHYDLDSLGMDPEESVARRIKNVRRKKLARLLALVPPCDESEAGFRDWWCIWLPLAAGVQYWPDGNHRTAMAVADLVAEALGFEIVMDVETIEELRVGSKDIITRRFQHKPKVEPEEFLDPDHELRVFYRGFRDRFRLAPMPPTPS